MLTLQFIPYLEIEGLDSEKRLSKLIHLAKENKIVLLEGRLSKEEETSLIQKTMENIDDDFKGIELAVVYPDEKKTASMLQNLKHSLIKLVLGDRQGFTVIGPATIVKEIKRDPNKIQLFTQEDKKRK